MKNFAKYLFIAIGISIIYLLGSIISHKVFLIDDLGILENSFYDIIHSSNFTSRPLSGIPTGIVTHLSKYSNYFLYFGYIFLIISIFLIYKTTKLYTEHSVFSALCTLFYVLAPLSTSTFYSVIMLNSSLAISFYCLSLIFLKKEYNTKNLLLSSLFFIASFLSYEICLPLLLLNILLVNRIQFKSVKNYLIYIALLGIIPISFYWLYKNVLEDLIYASSYNREEPKKIFDLMRNIRIFVKLGYIHTTELMDSMRKSIIAIQFYSIWDYLFLLIVSSLSILSIRKTNFKFSKNRNVLLFSMIGFCLGCLIFVFSGYYPDAYGFNNRTMAAIKLFFVLSFISTVFLLCRNYPQLGKIFLGVILVSFTISGISVKNAWVYANDFNHSLFQKTKNLIHNLPKEDKEIYKLAIDYDSESIWKDQHFILKEPIYTAKWETYKLTKLNDFEVINGGGNSLEVKYL